MYTDFGINVASYSYFFQLPYDPIPFPQLGAGYRYQDRSNGFDLNLHFTTNYEIASAKLGFDYIFYPKPSLNKQFYLGVGPAIGAIFINDRNWKYPLVFSPEILFGKEYIGSDGYPCHWQANVVWAINLPLMGMIRPYPFISVSYAWGY